MTNKKQKVYLIDNPTLMAEWDWKKNDELKLNPSSLTIGSSKRAWWKCKICGHEWITRINHRTAGSGCSQCARLKLSTAKKENLLEKFPKLCEEWNYSKNKRKPETYYSQSNLMVWWKCKACGHEWMETISHRTTRNNNCPYCTNHRVDIGFNDLFSTHPYLKEEWDWEKNNALRISPYECTAGSKKEVWWRCKKGHSWKTKIYTRTKKNHTNCPKCSHELRTSFPEKAIAYYLRKSDILICENYKPNNFSNMELDIYLPTVNLAIEYDSKMWHKEIKKDLKKDVLCEKNSIILIRIREFGTPNYESSSIKFYFFDKKSEYIEFEKTLRKLFEYLNANFNTKIDLKINILKDTNNILNSYLTIEKENSIYNSSLINEWDWEKNAGINPRYISIFSNRTFWWKCKKGHYWQASPAHRSKGRNCPYCSRQKIIYGENDLESQYPNVAKEWDYNKNNLTPKEVNCKSNKKYWWICSKCGFSWQTTVYTRTGMNCGCPNCKNKKIKERYYYPSVEKSVAANLKLLSEWNYERNLKKPTEYYLNSNKKVWWKCTKGHEWQAVISSRNKGSGCPYCYKDKRKKKQK